MRYVKKNMESDISSIDSDNGFHQTLEKILKITCGAVNANSGTIMLADAISQELRMEASYGIPVDYIERLHDAARNIMMPAASPVTGIEKYHAVPDIFEEPGDRALWDISKELGFSSRMFVPLKRGLKVFGLLNIFMEKKHHFTNEEIDFVTIAASQISSMIQNTMVCEKLKNNIQELNTYKEDLENQLKEIYKKLYHSEKYLKTIIDSSLDGITVVNERGEFEFANDSYFKIIGWPKEEIIGKYFMKIIPADAREFVMEHWLGIQIDHGGIHDIKIQTGSGEIKYLHVSSSLVEIEGKNKIIVIVHDISENKKNEINLKISEAKYKDLFENARDGIFALDTEVNFTSVNNATLEILGETEEKNVVGTNFSRWLPPESLKIVIEALKKAISGEQINELFKLEIVRSNNEHGWIEINAWAIVEGNRVTGINGIAREISEKRELEAKLKASEALYKDLFKNADDPMYTHDLKGNILTINEIGLKLLAATEEEVIGSNISKWVTSESYKIFEDRVRKIFMNQPLEELVIMEVINNKGEHKWGEARTRLLRDGDKIIGTHGIMRDITEKKILELELKESEEKYRDLFDNAEDAMYVLDNEGNFKEMNKIGIQTLGCTKEEVIGTNISKWITSESMEIVNERRKKRLSGENVNKSDVIEIVCKNGEHRWADIKTREIKAGNRSKEVHGIARDVTENRILKIELKKSTKQQKLLCHLIQGTRGGKTRALILKHLGDKSYNANQLATVLGMDYKTIRHHLNVLTKNGIIRKDNFGKTDLYFIPDKMDVNLDDFKNEQ